MIESRGFVGVGHSLEAQVVTRTGGKMNLPTGIHLGCFCGDGASSLVSQQAGVPATTAGEQGILLL